MRATLDGQAVRLGRAIERIVNARSRVGDLLAARLRAAHPSARLARMRATLDGQGVRLGRAIERRLAEARRRVALVGGRLALQNPARSIVHRRQRVEALRRALDLAVAGRLRAERDRLAGLGRTLNAVSPLATLDRGYAIVTAASTGLAIRHAADVAPRQPVRVRFADGEVPGVLEPDIPAP
jgi:exodeoxyribonuclease VII large subunit